MAQPEAGGVRGFFRRVEPSTWFGLALAVLVVVFVLQNQRAVSILLFWLDLRSPLWLTMLVVFAAGWLVGALVRSRRRGR
ncbi:hypothetical protein [Georgenia yuyongxinii]